MDKYKSLGLKFNPFPPAASGMEDNLSDEELPISKTVKDKFEKIFRQLVRAKGPKVIPLIGNYGSGKTTFMKAYLTRKFEENRIICFYYENPGVQFYDLADTLLRTLGRYEFAKAIWELTNTLDRSSGQQVLLSTFDTFLDRMRKKETREYESLRIGKCIREKLHVTEDEEIANRFAKMVTETAQKPYFEYRDFVAGAKGSLVAENRESDYFKALISVVQEVKHRDGVAFLMDEFEEVSIGKTMSRSKKLDYLATLKHLINATQSTDLWIVMSMTDSAKDQTKKLDEALWDRFSKFEIDLNTPLEMDECLTILEWWISKARIEGQNDNDKSFPFTESSLNILKSRPDLRYPRTVVQISYLAIERALEKSALVPIQASLVDDIVEDYFQQKEGELNNA
jgi:GTPase SAR1 family protein